MTFDQGFLLKTVETWRDVFSEPLKKALERDQSLARALWIVLTVTCFLFALLPGLLELPPTDAKSPQQIELLRTVFYVVAGVLALAGFAMRRVFVTPKLLAKLAEKQPIFTENERQAAFELLSVPDRRFVGVFKGLLVPLITSLVLHESIAILGFILAIFSQDNSQAIPFAMTALGLNIFIYPDAERTYHSLRSKLERL